jgi:Flp pilus assembly protein TadD
MNVILLRGLVTASLIAVSTATFGQAADESALDALDNAGPAMPSVREPAGAAELRAAMRRIAVQPSDADALADAGNAALMLGDANAALNFFTRANANRPRNGRITAGLATATVRTENPFEALRLFDEAVRLGISERTIAADRALAFDLLGNFARAQQDYQLARSASSSDDLLIRQAISLSLAGQKAEADGMLLPLLQKNNGAAWRARAFMLAARGETRESSKVASGFMDARSAEKMERYLRQMPDLTAAQQAAAIHLGHFPANNIGRDSENVRRVAATIPAPTTVKNESRLIPVGEPLGNKVTKEKSGEKRSRKSERERVAKERAEQNARKNAPPPVKVAKADNTRLSTDNARSVVESARVATKAVARAAEFPPPETARPLVNVVTPNSGLPQPAPAAGNPVNVITPAPQPVFVATSTSLPTPSQQTTSSPSPSPSNIVQGPSENGGPVVRTAAVTAIPPVASPPTALPFDLAAIVGSIEIPDSEQKPSAVPVDLKKLKPAVPKAVATEISKSGKVDPKTAAKAVAAAHPARFWVQIATGDASALGFDYRKWTKKSADLFKGKDGWTSAWGKTDRLLVGPFVDLKASKKWEADFRKAGGGGFAWKSENGVVVTPLKGK